MIRRLVLSLALWLSATPAFASGFVRQVIVDTIAASGTATLNPMASGDVIAFGAYWVSSSDTGITITDNCGGTWSTDHVLASTVQGAVGHATGSSGNCTISWSLTGAVSTSVGIVFHEVNAFPNYDGSAVAFQHTSASGTDNASSGSITTTGADYIFGFACNANGIAPVAGTGFTQRVNNNGNSYESSEDLIQSGAGAQAATFSLGAGNANNTVGIVAFKPAAGTTKCQGSLSTSGVSSCGDDVPEVRRR